MAGQGYPCPATAPRIRIRLAILLVRVSTPSTLVPAGLSSSAAFSRVTATAARRGKNRVPLGTKSAVGNARTIAGGSPDTGSVVPHRRSLRRRSCDGSPARPDLRGEDGSEVLMLGDMMPPTPNVSDLVFRTVMSTVPPVRPPAEPHA
ncbi:hypothetical protein ACFVFS_37265 [Kitasatospora sp. NPDC057692]|uniref:hypothetical protein n=1 Tax=Kitasatospora sp. NPDC057692 TaxID=3346215 RepID=UPI0036C22B33